MTLRNVPTSFTLEQQRLEINELAVDLDNAVDGVQTFTGDKTFASDVTFQTNAYWGDGDQAIFGADNDMSLYHSGLAGFLENGTGDLYLRSGAGTAIHIEPAAGADSIIANAGGSVELYYNTTKTFETSSTGASVIGDLTVSSNLEIGQLTSSTGEIVIEDDLKFDAAGAHIEFTPSSWSGSAPYLEFWVGNNGGAQYAQIDGGNAGQLQIMNTGHPNGHLDLRTAKDFSVDCGGYYAILAQATGATKLWHPVSQEDILNPKFETTATGAKVNGFFESSLLVNTNNTPTAGEGIEMMYDSAASGGAAGTIQAYDRDGSALTRLRIKSSNWEILNDGAATFNGNTTVGAPDVSNASTGGVQVFASGQLRIQRDSAGTATDKRFQMYYGTTETASITADGFATFSGGNFQNMASTLSINTNNSSTKALDITGNGMSMKHALGSDIFFGTQNGSDGKIGTENNAALNLYANGYGNKITIDVDGSLTASKGNLKIVDVGDGTNSVKIITDPSSGGSGSKLIFDMDNSQESVTIYNSGLKIGSGGSDKLTLDGSGGTITFNSQTNATGTTSVTTALDHYEEGLFSPTLVGSTGGEATYGNRRGGYVRVGNLVHVYGYLSITDVNTISGTLRLGNFPFSTKNDSSYFHAPSFGWYTNLTGITAYGLGLDFAPGANSGAIVYGNGTGVTGLAVGNVTNSFSVEWAFTYRTDS